MISLLGGIFLGWSLGANDAANVFGTAVKSRMVKFWTAAILAALFVLVGALLGGQSGIETLQNLTPFTFQQAIITSVAAACTVTLMTILGLPVSTSQAVVGAILGVGLLNRQLNFAGDSEFLLKLVFQLRHLKIEARTIEPVIAFIRTPIVKRRTSGAIDNRLTGLLKFVGDSVQPAYHGSIRVQDAQIIVIQRAHQPHGHSFFIGLCRFAPDLGCL